MSRHDVLTTLGTSRDSCAKIQKQQISSNKPKLIAIEILLKQESEDVLLNKVGGHFYGSHRSLVSRVFIMSSRKDLQLTVFLQQAHPPTLSLHPLTTPDRLWFVRSHDPLEGVRWNGVGVISPNI